MTWITCKIRKGHREKKALAVCEKCPKRGKCPDYREWKQPKLKGA